MLCRSAFDLASVACVHHVSLGLPVCVARIPVKRLASCPFGRLDTQAAFLAAAAGFLPGVAAQA